MPRSLALTLAWVGVATMVAASLYAPAQPELFQDGASCEIAPCGMLEDPERWRTAWWVWGAGLVVLLAAVPFTALPTRVRPLVAAFGLLTAPLWLLGSRSSPGSHRSSRRCWARRPSPPARCWLW